MDVLFSQIVHHSTITLNKVFSEDKSCFIYPRDHSAIFNILYSASYLA